VQITGRIPFNNAVGSNDKYIPSVDRFSPVLRSGIVEKGDRNARIIDKPRIIEVTSYILSLSVALSSISDPDSFIPDPDPAF
jgi:hypothetical protein